MVREGRKVPAALLLALMALAAGCGGEARSAEGQGDRATAAAARAVSSEGPATRGAPEPGSRAAAAAAVQSPPPSPPPALPPARPQIQPRAEPESPHPDHARLGPETPPVEVSLEPDPLPAQEPEPPPDEAPSAPSPESPGDGQPEPPAEDEPPAPPPAEPPPLTLAAGLEIALVLEETLSTQSHSAGDVFFAYVNDDVLAADGMVLVSLGARARGRVVEVHKSSGPNDPAVLDVVVEALISDGRAYPIVASVVGTGIDAGTGESTGRTVAKIGVGAAAGAILGKLLGKNTEAAVVGAVAGAAAGTAAALSSRDGHATIPEGSELVIRLDVPVELESR